MSEMPQIMASGLSIWQIMASIFPWIQMLEMPLFSWEICQANPLK